MPEEFEDEKEEAKEYQGPVEMVCSFLFRNELSREIRCEFQTVPDAQRVITMINQAKQHSVPTSSIMISDSAGDVHIIDMQEVQATKLKVRTK